MKKTYVVTALLALGWALPAHAGWWENFFSQVSTVTKSDSVQQLLNTVGTSDSVSKQDASSALKDLLVIGSGKVVDRLSATDGFLADQAVQIALPEEFKMVDAALGRIGLNGLTEGLKTRMNRAAEAAMPEARALFAQTIQQMTWQDALAIVNGADDAATTYFRTKMTPALTAKFTPVVDEALQQAGAVQAYKNVMAQVDRAAAMPFISQFVPEMTTDLTAYTVKKTLDGAFHYLAVEEQAIRDDPAARTTALLKKVFSK